ncbi:MAG TPA: pyruvate dehydrogenase (acetyl-transferring) E1 component subunit alpha [Ktedonobacteraceae bacterium]|nr:pyruvate dehydrogenase (acetyl-transferring) E1 component subunit alpha [Ktedonobacteraceae bacterium]
MSTEQQKRSTRPKADDAATTPTGVVALLEQEDKDVLIDYFYRMVLIRHFEEKAAEMYTKARIGGYCHLNLGEEATVVGFNEALGPQDYIYANYREHGYAIARGIAPKIVMSELFGKEDGCSHGLGGSMHLFDAKRHFMGGYGIVGGQVPLATGAAFAVAYRGSHEVVACLMGDGTTNGGPFYESLNLAKIYHLPIVYVIINNGLGMAMQADKGSAIGDLYRKAWTFDIRSERVDGTDVLAVRDAMNRAVALAREQQEPSLIEAVSYRFRGHSVVDPDRYRDQGMVKRERAQNDPIAKFALRLKDAGIMDEQGHKEIEERVEQEIDEAVEFAEASPFPSVDRLFDYTYAPDDFTTGDK